MNPSAIGWIKKLLKEIGTDNAIFQMSEMPFYEALRQSGFIYGSNQIIVNSCIDQKGLTDEELSKTNLFIALLYTHHQVEENTNVIDSIIDFYTEINAHKRSVFEEFLGGRKSEGVLEKIIHKRVQIDDNVLTKNFNYFLTNALLYIDVLAYRDYLSKHRVSGTYIRNLEASLESVSINVLNSKNTKTKYDEGLIKLFESSYRYNDIGKLSYEAAIPNLKSDLEKQYAIDLGCMSTWGDGKIDDHELKFLHHLGKSLNVDDTTIKNSISFLVHFFTANMERIPLLSSKNIVKSFYNNSSKMVNKLITRNGKRLQKELKQSKDLMYLLTQSTIRDLTEDEQKKTQDQLLDIFKTIPSLAIFILPGGMILLPLVIKFIPKLLPSAFDDNRIEED